MKGRNTVTIVLLALAFFGVFFFFDHQSATQTQQSATVFATRQLETALEFYYLDHGHYPKMESVELVSTLKTEGYLQKTFPNIEVTYRVTDGGTGYELER